MFIIQFLATALFLVPLLTLWSLRIQERTTAWELALDIPFSIAIDLLAVVAVARFLPLDNAFLAIRAVWCVALVTIVLRRRYRFAWPMDLNGRMIAAISATTGLAFALGLGISRHFTVWDRPWHAPLVSSLGGQSLPFVNVFGTGERLHYHLSGDVIAACLRASSLSTISSNLALSLAHDMLFGLTAMTVGFLMVGFGVRRAIPVVLGGTALLLHGPIPMRNGLGEPFQAYAYHLYFSLTFRPHVPVAALMVTGILGILAVRVSRPHDFRQSRAVAMLMAIFALLAISDEPTLALLGLGLGGMLLVFPDVLAKNHIRAVGVLVAIGVSALLPNLLFGGSLAPGGPIQRISWLSQSVVPAVIPNSSLPLASITGASVFLLDSLPYLICWMGLAAAAFFSPQRSLRPLVLMGGIVIVASSVLALHLRVNNAGNESQRFFVAPFFVTLLFGLLYLHRLQHNSLARFALLFGLVVPPFYSLYWIREVSHGYMRDFQEPPKNSWARETTYEINCRAVAGARLGERPKPTYVDMHHYDVFSSCRPIFGAGYVQPPWSTRTYPEIESHKQLRELVGSSGTSNIDTICVSAPEARHDPVCAYAIAHGREHCTLEGTRFLRCSLSAQDCAEILRH